MRIIGGTHRGRLLKRVMKETTRETADMVKEAVFNMLGGHCFGVVLDLYAGSGAYGLEAISRGASKAIFVDQERQAIQTVQINAKSLGMEMHIETYVTEDIKFIQMWKKERFDLIFLDPPYQHAIYEDVLLKLHPWINPDAYVVCESDRKRILPDTLGSLIKIKDKTYGIKRITIYQNERAY
jgi:16S rRNA (guanine(966)-N(2))-methyltransferase RsmD